MFKIASISLFLAYIFLLRLVSISQIGPDWEIPQDILREGCILLNYGMIFTFISCIMVLIQRSYFFKLKTYIKVTYICMLIIALCIINLGRTLEIYQIRVHFPSFINISKVIFWPGIIISLLFLILLLKGKSKEQDINKKL